MNKAFSLAVLFLSLSAFPNLPSVEEVFTTYDIDRDGALSYEEHVNFYESFSEEIDECLGTSEGISSNVTWMRLTQYLYVVNTKEVSDFGIRSLFRIALFNQNEILSERGSMEWFIGQCRTYE